MTADIIHAAINIARSLDAERAQKVVSPGRSGTAADGDHHLVEPLAAQKIVD
jgi:hypothetical protein